MVLGNENSTELSWSRAAQTSGYDVSAVRQFSGSEYHLKGQPDVKLQPVGDYATVSQLNNTFAYAECNTDHSEVDKIA